MECTFEGIARRIDIRGRGTTSLLRAAAFEQGLATRVTLATAKVGPVHAPVTLSAPELLDPIDLDPTAKDFQASYELGAELRIDIASGAARAGRFRGKLAGAPACAEADGCEVSWPDSTRIVLSVVPDRGRVAAEAQRGKPIRITGWFPFVVERERGAAGVDRLDRVALDGATGALVCDGARTDVSGRLVWAAGEDRGVRIGQAGDPTRSDAGRDGEGISITPEGLRLRVVSSFAPEQAAPAQATAQPSAPTQLAPVPSGQQQGAPEPSGQQQEAPEQTGPWLWIGVLAVAVVVVVVTLVVLLRRRAGPAIQRADGAPEGEANHRRAEGTAPAGDAKPIALVLLAAPEDAAFSAALVRHLRPYAKPLFDPHDAAYMPAGADLLAETRSAIESAHAVAVLVSADLFSAPEPWSELLALAMKLRRERGLTVVPVLARPVAWEATELGGLTVLPAKGEIGSADNDAALAEVARGLAACV